MVLDKFWEAWQNLSEDGKDDIDRKPMAASTLLLPAMLPTWHGCPSLGSQVYKFTQRSHQKIAQSLGRQKGAQQAAYQKPPASLCRDKGCAPCVAFFCRYTETEAAQVVHGVLEALAYCHSLGVMHRDIKPENIMVRTDEGWLLIAGRWWSC